MAKTREGGKAIEPRELSPIPGSMPEDLKDKKNRTFWLDSEIRHHKPKPVSLTPGAVRFIPEETRKRFGLKAG